MTARLVVVAIGANAGEPVRQVRAAIARLAAWGGGSFRSSSLWRSAPIDCPTGSPGFVNAVASLEAGIHESAEIWLDRLQALEREFGRRPAAIRNAPRPLDLDLIQFGDERCGRARLTLPHPRAHEREFVLRPLAEILPALLLPGQTRSVESLLAAIGSAGGLVRIDGAGS